MLEASGDRGDQSYSAQIELDEWEHRAHVLNIMNEYDIPVSQWLELKFHLIGKTIGLSCHVIGWFMPYFFAGKLESGNVCEYFRMMQNFHELNIHDHDVILYDMGMKEKEHEMYFLEKLKGKKWLPYLECLFHWGQHKRRNDVDLTQKFSVPDSYKYCRHNSQS